MVTRPRHRSLRLFLAGLLGLTPLLIGLTTVGPPAQAEPLTPIPDQWYVTATGLDQLKSQDLDGSGITIAIIDTPIDPTVPELQGANITVKSDCDGVRDTGHGTSVLSVLADPVWGWAPKAHYLTYAVAFANDHSTGCHGNEGDFAQQAINDGADIISISASLGVGPFALVRAAAHGIPIVTAVDNNGKDQAVPLPVGLYNIAVYVGAGDHTGQRADFSSYGPGLTITAPGVDITCRDPNQNGDMTATGPCLGTSLATPMVTGALALAMQRWPVATGNQLVASMIATANRESDQWDKYLGWGTLNATALVGNDPSVYPNTPPLLNNLPGTHPTQTEFTDYLDGTLLTESPDPLDTDYHAGQPTVIPGPALVIPGWTPAPTGPTGQPTGSTIPQWVIPVGVVVLVVIVGLILTVVVVARRRSSHSPSSQAGGFPPGAVPGVPGSAVPPGYPGTGYPASNPPPGYPGVPTSVPNTAAVPVTPSWGYPGGPSAATGPTSHLGYPIPPGNPGSTPPGIPPGTPPGTPPTAWPPTPSQPGGPPTTGQPDPPPRS